MQVKSTSIKRGHAARSIIVDTVIMANDLVGSTLGPGGSNVLIQTDQGCKITKDGVSCLISIVPENPFESAVLNVIKDSAMKTNKSAGDGTSSTVALISRIVLDAIRRKDGLNGIHVRNGLMLAADVIVKQLKKLAIPVEDLNTVEGESELRQIAVIATNGDTELADMLVAIFKKCGLNANIKLEMSNTAVSEYNIVEGFQLPKGYLSTYFADDTGVITMNNPDIYVCEKAVSNMPELMPIITTHMQMDKPFVIIAPKFELSVLNALVMYKMRGLKVCCVLLAEFGTHMRDTLEDVAILTGATLISEQTNVSFKSTDVIVPGSAKTVIIDELKTTIIDGCGNAEAISTRANSIKAKLTSTTDAQYIENMQRRLDSIVGGIAIMSIGGNTAARARERYDLADDAIHACKAAIESGILPGAGSALLQCKYANKNNTSPEFSEFFADVIQKYGADSATHYGAKLLFDACDVINKLVITNALNIDAVYAIQHKLIYADAAAFTFNTIDLKTERIGDALELGIIDPANVIINEILNAAEAAGTLLTMESIIVNEPKKMDISETLTSLAT